MLWRRTAVRRTTSADAADRAASWAGACRWARHRRVMVLTRMEKEGGRSSCLENDGRAQDPICLTNGVWWPQASGIQPSAQRLVRDGAMDRGGRKRNEKRSYKFDACRATGLLQSGRAFGTPRFAARVCGCRRRRNVDAVLPRLRRAPALHRFEVSSDRGQPARGLGIL